MRLCARDGRADSPGKGGASGRTGRWGAGDPAGPRGVRAALALVGGTGGRTPGRGPVGSCEGAWFVTRAGEALMVRGAQVSKALTPQPSLPTTGRGGARHDIVLFSPHPVVGRGAGGEGRR